jgi:hypothetical protein
MAIGTLEGGALIGGALAAQNYFGNKSTKKARDAAQAAADEIKRAKATAIGYQQPFYQSGQLGLSPLTGLLTGQQYDPRTGNTTYLNQEQRQGLFQASPGYQFRLDQGQKTLEASQAARGGLLSGGAAKELNQYSQGIASDEYSNYISQLMGLTGIGQNAANAMGNIEIGAGNSLADYTQAGGLAEAQKYANRGSAIGGALSQFAGLAGMGAGAKSPPGGASPAGASSQFQSAGAGQYNTQPFMNYSPNPTLR